MSDRFHVHAIKEGPSFLRHGRAFATAYNRGRRSPHGRSDLHGQAEWRFLVPKGGSFGIGAKFKWGTNGSDTTPDFSLHLSRLGDVWLGVGGVIPYRWLERYRPDGKVDYETRVFEIGFSHDHFNWSFWARDGHWSRSDPWWMYQYHRWDRLAFGPTKHSTEIVESGTCVVPMPERNYEATYAVEKMTWTHTRWTGRLRDRLLGAKSAFHTEIAPGRPIAVPGKGENSWDCDDDAIYSSSIGGRNVSEAIGKLVASALSTRARHGGQHMSLPPGVPAE